MHLLEQGRSGPQTKPVWSVLADEWGTQPGSNRETKVVTSCCSSSKRGSGESYDVMMLCAARKVEAFQLRWPNRVEEWRPAVSLSCWEICDAQRKAGGDTAACGPASVSRTCYKLARPLTTHWHALTFSHSIDLSHQQNQQLLNFSSSEEPDELLRTSNSH